MLAPGVPTSIAGDIASHIGDPAGMARAVVARTMATQYDAGPAGTFGPAAAFDVIDLDPKKIAAMQSSIKNLDTLLVRAAADGATRSAIREDARAIDGMVRFPGSSGMPWHADRPAMALYDTFAHDGRLSTGVRTAAKQARDAVAATVMAHKESGAFEPFAGSDYSDAVGPTVHFPVNARQIDAWAPNISETHNAFYADVGAAALARVIA